MLETFIKYPLIFLSGFLATLLLTPLWRRWARSNGFVDHPGGRKIHAAAIPVAGGIAIFIGFHIACASVFLLPWKPFAGQISIDWWFRFIPLSMGVVLLGLIDDRFGMNPKVKLVGQTLLALGAYALNIRIQNVLGMDLPEWVDFCGTIFWFLAIMNAFNFIDGIDGLATGIALIAAIGIGVSLLFRHSPGDVLLLIGFAGACFGFLRYNYYPASVFLGDTGSLFLGFTLAALTISTNSKGPAMAAIGVPILALGIPLFDTILAVWRRSVRRLLKGRNSEGERISIDQGDAEHLHHRLLLKGREHDQVAWLLYAATALLALTGIFTTAFNDRVLGILGIAFVVTAYVVFRHLAQTELRDTGEVVLRGIAKPVHRNRSLIIYMAIDLIILNSAWLLSTLLVDLQAGSVTLDLKSNWIHAIPVDVVIPFLVLMAFRSYSRTWSLAGIIEYATVGLAGLVGCAVVGAIHLITLSADGNPWGIILHKTLFFGLAIPGIVGVRAALRAVQDLMNRSWGLSPASRAARDRAVVAGIGSDVMLYFRQRALYTEVDSHPLIIGIISNDDALRGHFVNGVQVFGTPEDIPAVLQEKEAQKLIWAGDLSEGEEASLRKQLQGMNVKLVHWCIVETDILL